MKKLVTWKVPQGELGAEGGAVAALRRALLEYLDGLLLCQDARACAGPALRQPHAATRQHTSARLSVRRTCHTPHH
jgi:hypothetical protein